jgi:hypothetical protein
MVDRIACRGGGFNPIDLKRKPDEFSAKWNAMTGD